MVLSENDNVTEIFSKSFLALTGISLGGLQKAVKNLLVMNYIFKGDDNRYRILDPLIKAILRNDRF